MGPGRAGHEHLLSLHSSLELPTWPWEMPAIPWCWIAPAAGQQATARRTAAGGPPRGGAAGAGWSGLSNALSIFEALSEALTESLGAPATRTARHSLAATTARPISS